MTQGEGSWNASQHSSCQCYTEVRLSPSFPMLSLIFVSFTLTFGIYFLLVGPNGGDHLPSSVVGSSWPSRAHRINRSVMLLICAGSLIPTLHFEIIHHFPSIRPCLRLATMVLWRSSVSAQRVSDATALAAAASQQLLRVLQAAAAHVWPGDSCSARHAEKNPWAEREWRYTHKRVQCFWSNWSAAQGLFREEFRSPSET